MAHCKYMRVLSTIAGAALCLLLLSAHSTSNYAHVQEVSSAQLFPPSSKHPQSGSRDGEAPARNPLRLPLLHRHQTHTPHISTVSDRIVDIIRMDRMRVMGFSTSFHNHPTHIPSASPALGTVDLVPTECAKGSVAHTQHRKKQRNFEGKIISGASLAGNIGQYFVEFFVGTPGQRLLFITDTGSDLIWVQCASQLSMPSASSFFPEASSTFNPIMCASEECGLVPPPLNAATCNERSPTSCTYAYVYTDLSQTTGTFVYDTIAMESAASSRGSTMQITNVAFGCGMNNSGPSITNVAGVMGLGQGPLSFASQIGHIYGNKFSYCFTSFFHRKSTSSLVFGDDRVGARLQSPLQFAPLVSSPVADTFYHLQIEEMKVDKKPLAINSSIFSIDEEGNGGVVIDSGTTLTFFLKPAYDAIVKAFKKKVHYPLAPPTAGLHVCYNVSRIAKPRFPRIAIIFKGGAIFRPPSRNYFLSPTRGIKCLGIMGGLGMSVLGNLIQQNYYVEYDRLNNQLGFAKANCSTSF